MVRAVVHVPIFNRAAIHQVMDRPGILGARLPGHGQKPTRGPTDRAPYLLKSPFAIDIGRGVLEMI